MVNNYLTETKVSKSSNNKGKSFTYSTVIPKPIVKKFGLEKGQKLNWDIKGNDIIITPELPEAPSIEAGINILNDILINGKSNYAGYSQEVLRVLDINTSQESKVKTILNTYNSRDKPEKEKFKQVVTYLLDYPKEPEKQEVLQAVYDEITKD